MSKRDKAAYKIGKKKDNITKLQVSSIMCISDLLESSFVWVVYMILIFYYLIYIGRDKLRG